MIDTEGLATMVYNIFDNKIGSGATGKIIANVNEVLPQELRK